MRVLLSVQRILLVAAVLLVLLPGAVSAQWITDGTPLCTSMGEQELPCIVPDGAGGAIIAWNYGNDLFVQRIDKDGYALWAANGIDISPFPITVEAPVVMIPDGSGGAIIAWQDYRVTYDDIYAQRIDASGTVLWTVDGVPICTEANYQISPVIVSDGSGGAVIAWHDMRPVGGGIYAQRILSGGTVDWTPGGVMVSDESRNMSDLRIVESNYGSTILVWADNRPHQYAQKLSSNGMKTWGTDGVSYKLGINSANLISDGAGGAIVLWSDSGDWIARKIMSTGVLSWQETVGNAEIVTGLVLSGMDFMSDGYGGGILCWSMDLTSSLRSRMGVWATKFDDLGQTQWGTDGLEVIYREIDFLSYSISHTRMVSDGAGGAIITWEYYSLSGQDIEAQRVSSDCILLYEPDDMVICSAAHNQHAPEIISDGARGAIIVWEDERTPATEKDIYAQRIYEHECEVSPTALDFGTVVLGNNRDRTFTITNVGGIPLTGSITEACPEFSIISTVPPDDPFSLETGEELVVTVRFEPTVTGPQPCTIDTGDSTCFDVECTGTGLDCPTGIAYVDSDATGIGDGSSWTDAFTELRDALEVHRFCGTFSEIWIAEGTYTPTAGTDRSATFLLNDNFYLFGGFDGTEMERDDRDVEANPTILSGDLGGVNSYHVVTKETVSFTTLVLDGFTIRDGVADGAAEADQCGGGLYTNSYPTLRNLTFTSNTAAASGGGIYCETSNPYLDHVTFDGNSAEAGGGMYCSNNNPALLYVTFSNNTATTGAGMYNQECTPVLRRVTFSYNNGRAIYNDNTDGIIRECVFDHNSDGGIYNNGSSPEVINTIFYENSSTSGGGMRNANGSSPQLVNVTFYNNTATTGGGAIQNGKFSSPVITNSIFWGNYAPVSPEMSNGLLCIPVISYSLIEGCGGSGGGWDTALGTDGGNNIDDDPDFKLNSSSDPYLSLWSSSPVINAGSNAAVPYSLDLAGNPRIHDTTVDLGAYEHQGGTITDVEEDLPQVPDAFALYQNSPNPFNPVTTIRFDLPHAEHVKLVVYNVKGELVATLADQNMTAGHREITWDAKDSGGRTATSGVYFYRLVAGDFVETKKMILLR